MEIRCLSKEAGLFTWNKPAYACLATRIQTGTGIEVEMLKKVDAGEKPFRCDILTPRARYFMARLSAVSAGRYDARD